MQQHQEGKRLVGQGEYQSPPGLSILAETPHKYTLADAQEGSAEQHHCWLRPLALCQPPTAQPALDALFVEPGHTHHSPQSIGSCCIASLALPT